VGLERWWRIERTGKGWIGMKKEGEKKNGAGKWREIGRWWIRQQVFKISRAY
jgi:hypothetical protein